MTDRMVKPVQIVVGGQWGSEAKGSVAAHLVIKDQIDIAVRTGATNAGHTAWYNGRPVVMQQLPVGFIRPETVLVLGPGALIDVDILRRECALIEEVTGEMNVRKRLLIDHRAYIHRTVHHDRSVSSNRHHLMGATGKGCSEALVDRVKLRGVEDWTVGKHPELFEGYNVTDTEKFLNESWDKGAAIQLEGTQGQLLDLYLGPYPYTTHKQTGPAQWMLECGLSPALPTDIVMVVRTFPIRVAGNSGPMPQEISWPMLAREINHKRDQQGYGPIVDEAAIQEFEEAVRWAVSSASLESHPQIHVPTGSDGLDQHEWPAVHRVQYRAALSELHKVALASLDERTIRELRNLFEMTTVTKKLRRIARLDHGELARAARQIRPHRVAVTFLNYAFPDKWFTNHAAIYGDEGAYLNQIQESCGAPVFLANRGPAPEHFIEIEEE